jgi:predicted metal-dependent hydrolase
MRARDNGRAQLCEKVRYWSRRLQVEARIVRVQRMTRKWGSCSTTGIVTLAEDLIEQEPGFQDFVIAHELLHLRIPTHGRLFKALMTVHVPAWRQFDVARRRERPREAPATKLRRPLSGKTVAAREVR